MTEHDCRRCDHRLPSFPPATDRSRHRRRVSLAFAPGTVAAVTGPSGSGKSTLLHLIGAIERRRRRPITVDDVEITAFAGATLAALPPRGRLRLPALPPAARADRAGQRHRAGAAVPGGFDRRGPRPANCSTRSGSPAGRTSLPSQLSGGQQQRVAIARALMNRRACCWPTSRPATSTRAPAREILDLLLELRDRAP